MAQTVLSMTSQLIAARLAKQAARLPTISHTDNRGRRSTLDTAGITIGSLSSVDVSYCVEATDVTYVAPTT